MRHPLRDTRSRAESLWLRLACLSALALSIPISAPAQNERPLPVSTMTRVSSSSRKPAAISSISIGSRALIGLSFSGRLKYTVAIAPARSTIKFSYAINSSPCLVAVSAPYAPRHVRDQFELAPLIVGREQIAAHRAGETALRAEREPLERHVTRGLVDPPTQRLGRLQHRRLGADEPEHHGLVRRHEAQRGEIAGTLGVVLEKKRLDAHFIEEPRGDRLIASRGEPSRAQIAAAQMHPDRHPRRPRRERVIDRVDIGGHQRFGILAYPARPLAHR